MLWNGALLRGAAHEWISSFTAMKKSALSKPMDESMTCKIKKA
jgi:hypothetical protein